MKRSNRDVVGVVEMPLVDGYYVRPIDKQETHVWLLEIHYARRIPAISFAYGLFDSGEMVGVITYGQPPSRSLCIGVAGPDNADLVIELNRLALKYNRPNEASRLIGQSLRLLPAPRIVVSYADSDQDHLGVVYQATNWIYTGITKPRTEWAVRGQEHLHSKSLGNRFASLDEVIAEYGDDFYYRERSQKHRYVQVLGTRSDRRRLMADLRYEALPYPKRERTDARNGV